MFHFLRRTTCQTIKKELQHPLISRHLYQYRNTPQLAVITKIVDEPNHTSLRFKSGSKKAKQQSSGTETDQGGDDEEDINDKQTKTLTISVKSLRIDAFLKSGFGMARNKVETLFYDSKIRMNGEKVLKKSAMVQDGDELDIIKGPSPSNPDFLSVARLEVLNIIDMGDNNMKVKVRRTKNLVIEKYND